MALLCLVPLAALMVVGLTGCQSVSRRLADQAWPM